MKQLKFTKLILFVALILMLGVLMTPNENYAQNYSKIKIESIEKSSNINNLIEQENGVIKLDLGNNQFQTFNLKKKEDLKSTNTIYFDDFEDYNDFSISPSGIIMMDKDGGNTGGVEGYSWNNIGVPQSFIIFNPSSTNPEITNPAMKPHSGNKFAGCIYNFSPPNNDWMVFPNIELGTNSEFRFWAKAFSADFPNERFRVYASTDGESFLPLTGALYTTAAQTWAQHNYDISDFDNQKVFIAIQCVSNDQFMLMIDDVEIETNDSDIQPESNFMANNTSIQLGSQVQFTSLSTDANTYQWTFEGGSPSTSNAQNPTITYNSEGNFNVTLTVTNGDFSDTKIETDFIDVYNPNAALTVDFVYEMSDQVCEGDSYYIESSVSGGDGNYTYQWILNDEAAVYATDEFIWGSLYLTTTFKLVVRSGNEITEFSKTFKVLDSPQANIVSKGDPPRLLISTNPEMQYKWYHNNVVVEGQTNQYFYAGANEVFNGTYYVVVTNENNCSAASSNLTVRQDKNAEIFTQSPNKLIVLTPNPADKFTKLYLNPQYSGFDNIYYQLLNNLGQTVMELTKYDSRSIDVSDLETGLYHIVIYQDNDRIGQEKLQVY